MEDGRRPALGNRGLYRLPVFHVSGRGGGDRGTEETADDVEGAVEAGGDAGGGQDFPVVVEARCGIDRGGRGEFAQGVEALVVGRHAQPVE
jgi:hypothetical protein